MDAKGGVQVCLVRATAEEARAMDAADKAARLEALDQGAGFVHVLQVGGSGRFFGGGG